MYGSYLLDKHHWPLVFECVKAMASELRKGRSETCACSSSSGGHRSSSRYRCSDDKIDHDDDTKNIDQNDGKCIDSAGVCKMRKANENCQNASNCNCGVLPLFCKIRICEDGIDSYKATEAFCKGEAK